MGEVWQDVLVGVYLVVIGSIVLYGVTGLDEFGKPADRHNNVHKALIFSAILTPFVSFDFSELDLVPDEAWGVCATMVFAQLVHTATHLLKPEAKHSTGPEILFQPLIIVWATSVARRMPAKGWHRDHLGSLMFCLNTVFICLSVLMVIYIQGSGKLAGDEINYQYYSLRSPSNYGFTVAGATALLIALYAAWGSPWYLLAAGVVFLSAQLFFPPLDESVPRKGNPDGSSDMDMVTR